MSTPINAFRESSEKLPPANPRDTLLAQVNADCKRLRDLCWAMRDFAASFAQARKSATASGNITADALTSLLAQQNEFTCRERDILDLRRSIEIRVETYNCGLDERDRIYLAHTCEGLPIRADKTRKTPIWG